MKANRIGIVSVFIILLSVSCRSGEDMSAYFDEGRIENNTYISDSTGWNMTGKAILLKKCRNRNIKNYINNL